VPTRPHGKAKRPYRQCIGPPKAVSSWPASASVACASLARAPALARPWRRRTRPMACRSATCVREKRVRERRGGNDIGPLAGELLGHVVVQDVGRHRPLFLGVNIWRPFLPQHRSTRVRLPRRESLPRPARRRRRRRSRPLSRARRCRLQTLLEKSCFAPFGVLPRQNGRVRSIRPGRRRAHHAWPMLSGFPTASHCSFARQNAFAVRIHISSRSSSAPSSPFVSSSPSPFPSSKTGARWRVPRARSVPPPPFHSGQREKMPLMNSSLVEIVAKWARARTCSPRAVSYEWRAVAVVGVVVLPLRPGRAGCPTTLCTLSHVCDA